MASPDVQIQKRWLSRRWRLSLTCVSIALNAATAGGVFTFPLISESSDIGRFRLTQPQISSIVLAGMTIGQYPAAPFVGSAIDRIGPWACSLMSAILFSTGFGLFSLEFRNTPEQSEHGPSKWSFYRLVFFYFLAGLGTVTSYFSALFSAQKNFPKYSGLAAGFSLALFGLSPLILSLFASAWFTDPVRGLRVAGFTAFLAILTGAIHLLGAINLHVETEVEQPNLPTPSREGTVDDVEAATERTPLIRPDSKKLQSTFSAWEILNDYDFWILAAATLLTLGACEMVVANIGTISLALPPKEATSGVPFVASNSTVSTATTQVRLLSLSNTISRLTSGAMADFVSPVASYLPSGLLALPHKHKISRVAFLLGSCLLMSLSFLWMVFGVTTRQGIWAFSVGIGIAYGATFTVLPSLVASIWGTANIARNFGLISYAPFIGTPAFSYLYAFIASAATESKDPDGYSEGACFGKQCWRLTFLISAAGGFAAAFCSIVLWKKWHGRL